MSPSSTPYFLTTPIYYVNDSPHIGHAYTSLACDVIARFLRSEGSEVMFLTGTDEHGQKVEKSAKQHNLDPQKFVDEVSKRFRKLSELMDFSNDDFIRTTEARHIKSCQALWKRISDGKTPNGQDSNIYLGKYDGWYSVRDEAFYDESELIKDTKNPSNYLAPTGASVEWVEEPSYFFRLSAWQDKLLEFYENNPEFVAPQSRRNEVISFVKGGLRDLSISRTSFSWGIPVPDDDSHIMYVWLDALTNYITGINFPEITSDKWNKYWPASLHMVGKDILRFHAVYWPAFLMSAGIEPPQRVFAHGWWTNEGQKISKSLGNVIDPEVIVRKYGVDAVRYFLLREVPFGNDGYFSHASMVTRINKDLANDFGNLAQRVLSMISKNFEGVIPYPQKNAECNFKSFETLSLSQNLLSKVSPLIHKQAFNEALDRIWEVVREANRSIDKDEPWKLKKKNKSGMGTILWLQAETIRNLAIILKPFMPQSMDRLLDQLNIPLDERNIVNLHEDNEGDICQKYSLRPDSKLPKPVAIFPKYICEFED
ncbi:MAG: methionine--tRNA ligase [Rhodospirillaceae bacterium]|nr:methionine--tRNA ligase [Rhodospirillaceae bacterium]